MKKTFAIAVLLIFCWTAPAFAGHAGATGDADWDTILLELNSAAGSDSRRFARQTDQRYGVGEGTAERLMKKPGFTAADVCIALKLSFITHRPLDDIVRVYEADRSKGWGAVAKNLGIKPGSREFHELKNDSRSYLDETKGKGKGKNKNKGKDISKSGKGKNK